MAFNVQAALKAGYTQEEISQYLASQQKATPSPTPTASPAIQTPVPTQQGGIASSIGGGVLGLLKTLLEPAVRTGKDIGGAGFELLRAGKQALGDKNAYVDQRTGKVKENPFLSQQELKSISENPLKEILKGPAQVGSYAIPFGKGASIATKALLPGAAIGAISGAGQDNATIESITGNAILGAGGAGVLHGGSKLLDGILGLGSKTSNKIGAAVSDRAAQGIGKATPSQATKAIEEHGLDINRLIEKHFPKGGNYETMLGDVTKRGSGGVLGFKIGQAENTIDRAINAAGSTIKISGDDLLKELSNQRRLLKSTVGNEANVKALDAIIEETQNLFKNGLTTKKLLTLKRAADSKFGSAVVDETTGSVAAQAQKMLANFARNKLKQVLPTVKEALDTETELYTLKPILNRARGTLNTQGSQIRTGAFSNVTDFANPKAYIDAAMNNPKIASRLLKQPGQTNNTSALSGILGNKTVGQLSGQVASRLPSVIPAVQPKEQNNGNTTYSPENNQPSNDTNSQINHIDQSISQSDGEIKRKITYDQMQQVLLNTQLSAKAKNAVKDAYDLQEKAIKDQQTIKKPLTAQQQKDRANAESGIKAINTLVQEMRNDPAVLFKASIPGSPGARVFNTARNEAEDVLSRMRTGAAISETELKFYKNQLPQPFDSQRTIDYKIKLFNDLFSRLMGQEGAGIDPAELILQNQQYQ